MSQVGVSWRLRRLKAGNPVAGQELGSLEMVKMRTIHINCISFDWVLAWGLPRGGLRIMKQGVLKVYLVSSPQALVYKLQIVKF